MNLKNMKPIQSILVSTIFYFSWVKQSISSLKQAILSLEVIYSESGKIYRLRIFIFLSTCVKFILPLILGTYRFPVLLPQLYFILGQLENSIVRKNRRQYNMITIILSLKSHLASRSCYMQLRRMDCITLPHESSLNDYIPTLVWIQNS